MSAITIRVARLEQQIGRVDDDTACLIENLRAVAEGLECPNPMTPGMRRKIEEQLRQLFNENLVAENVAAPSTD